jgi:hypothetical protein
MKKLRRSQQATNERLMALYIFLCRNGGKVTFKQMDDLRNPLVKKSSVEPLRRRGVAEYCDRDAKHKAHAVRLITILPSEAAKITKMATEDKHDQT